MMGISGPSLPASLLPAHPFPQLGSLPWACWSLSMPFKVPGPPPLLRLPQVSQQKPPFAWLWNKPLGEPMRQQLDQLQRPSAHISVPGQACWHPAKLVWASLTAWSSSCVGPVASICGEPSKGLEAWEMALLTSPASAPVGCLCIQQTAVSLSAPGLGQGPSVSGQGR